VTVHAFTELSDFQIGYLSLVFHVNFVCTYYDILDWLVTVEIVLVNPLVEIVKALYVRDVEYKYAAACPPIVHSGNCLELLLTSGVPYL
jgi:hypothetical protein